MFPSYRNRSIKLHRTSNEWFLYNEDSDLNPAGIYLLKVNNRNFRNRSEIYSKLTIKTPEQRH